MANSTVRRPFIFGDIWFPNGESMFNVARGAYKTNPNQKPSEGLAGNQYGVLFTLGTNDYPFCLYYSIGSGTLSFWNKNTSAWITL